MYARVRDTNIDLKLWNKLHGPMHYKIGVTCTRVEQTQYIYSVVILRKSNPPISQFSCQARS